MSITEEDDDHKKTAKLRNEVPMCLLKIVLESQFSFNNGVVNPGARLVKLGETISGYESGKNVHRNCLQQE